MKWFERIMVGSRKLGCPKGQRGKDLAKYGVSNQEDSQGGMLQEIRGI
jgi:hypothetical protein